MNNKFRLIPLAVELKDLQHFNIQGEVSQKYFFHLCNFGLIL